MLQELKFFLNQFFFIKTMFADIFLRKINLQDN